MKISGLTAACELDGENIIVAIGNKIYKIENKVLDRNLTEANLGEPIKTVNGVKNITDMTVNGDSITITSEQGKQIYSGISGDEELKLTETLISADISFSTSYEGKNGTYFVKDDRSKIGYSRSYVEITNGVQKALTNNINAAGARKETAFALVESSNGNLNLNEALQILPDAKSFNGLITSNDFNGWHKEIELDINTKFVRNSGSVIVSNSDSSIFTSKDGATISTRVKVQKEVITDPNKLAEIYDDIDRQLGNNLKVVRSNSIDLSDQKIIEAVAKPKEGLLLESSVQNQSLNFKISFDQIGNTVVTGQFLTQGIEGDIFEGEEFDYQLLGMKNVPSDFKVTGGYEIVGTPTSNGNDTTVKLKATKTGKQRIGFTGSGYDFDVKDSLNVVSSTISVKGLGSTLRIKEGQVKTFQVENYNMFSSVSVNLPLTTYEEGTEISSATYSYDNTTGKLAITGGKSGEALDITVSAQSARPGVTINSINSKLTVFIPGTMPLWLIILLAVLLVLLLSGVGYFVWWKFFRSEFQNRQPRYAAIAADKHAVAKAKKTETAKIRKDKGIVRSGLFERELEYNLDKLNDPDYESKYVWVNDGKSRVEDMEPVLNNWDKSNNGNRKPNKKDPELESRLQNVKKGVKK
ncbi:hypothetical protein [Spiroplasma monobiae]|uniref:Uncharacterized protein n=1 Tax=Spiroplasma monobiae MQ-1 TaxID=1336748 RepID=A0A2K9LUM3_SPISQ|nr:hypothetical protein [Spiroplasma monobiae]AUM62746.1 hypothetical protein SMONO_v1c04970 [Spiroplasma monobiae MQ-1]